MSALLTLRPQTLSRHAAEITATLERSGWVSPGAAGPAVYMIGFRGCPDCIRYVAREVPALQAAGADTRVIEVARADVDGVAKSTPVERSTVAELWANRSWALFERWSVSAPADWTAAGIPPADGDPARSSLVEAGRKMVEDLRPLLADNGVDLRYPTLIWRAADGSMRGCVCEDPATYPFVRAELGAA